MTDTKTIEVQIYNSEAVQIREAGLTLRAQAEELVIVDDEMFHVANTMTALITKGLNLAKTRKVEIKAPVLAEYNSIDATFRTAFEPFEAAKDIIDKKISAYHKAQKDAEDAARREQERIEREQILERARVAAEAAAKGETPPAPLPAPPPPAQVPEVASVTKTEAGNVGMVKHRGFKIVDESQIPREYWLINEKAIAAKYKSGGDVPGCEEDISYTTRVR